MVSHGDRNPSKGEKKKNEKQTKQKDWGRRVKQQQNKKPGICKIAGRKTVSEQKTKKRGKVNKKEKKC